jgi:GNAT superfamily N-acetyltransferase
LIDWVKTKEMFGRDEIATYNNDEIVVSCDKCGREYIRKLSSYRRSTKTRLVFWCLDCVVKDPGYKAKMSAVINAPGHKQMMSKKLKEVCNTDIYRQKVSINLKERHSNPVYLELKSQIAKKMWADPDFKSKKMEFMRSDEYRVARSKQLKDLWRDPRYRSRMQEIFRTDKHKQKMAVARSQQPRVSSIQSTLYSILDDLGVKYYREYFDKSADPETVIGPFSFDCVIPREGKPTLLIECQGDYWHSLDKHVKSDKAKASYIANNLSDRYELKCLWEHEFACKDKVIELVKYWLGITKLELVDFNFKNVEVRGCPVSDYRLFLSKYHYLHYANRGGITYGAYLGDELVAVCSFSSLIRQNIRTGDYDPKECRELSRLCIHPRYQKKNFASWFVSRCLNQLDKKYKLIISYCDTTFNHNGAVYKACNFELDREVPSDYWYVDERGWVMHKKTLYGKAVQLKLKESEFAEKFGYKRVYGSKKLRFIYER